MLRGTLLSFVPGFIEFGDWVRLLKKSRDFIFLRRDIKFIKSDIIEIIDIIFLL